VYIAVGVDIVLVLLVLALSELIRRLRKAKWVAERASNEKAEFLAKMCQEIQTPMVGIIGMTNLLFETKLSEQQRAFADVVQNSANSLMDLLNNAMVHTRLAEAPIQLEQVDFDLHSLLEDSVAHFAPQAMRKGIEIASVIPADVPTVICGDPVRLQQALSTLLSNAVKFSDQGEVSLSAKLVGEEKGGVILNFEVIDTGVGISEAEHGNVLEAFSRTATANHAGTRLGLPICRQIVSAAGGSLNFHSLPGVGSTFWVVMKFGRARVPMPAVPVDPAVKGKVVKIDVRSAVLQRSLLNYCVAMGLQPAASQTTAADLAIVDSDSKRESGPRIVISAEPTLDDHYVTKPVRYADLLRAVAGALAHQHVSKCP
jgi:two-component system, sensor histidine kinase and response regulator